MAGFLLTPGRLLATVVSIIALTCSLLAATPPRIVLVGDSTVTDHGGWGAGIRRFVSPEAVVENTAAGGRSSKSFIDEGRWTKALALKGDYYLIQFGHNDQPGKGPERETDPATTYAANMARYVDEVRAQGGQPVLVTSLTRRNFSEKNPDKIYSTLTPYVDAVKKLASAKNVPLIELHASSLAYCEQIGPLETAKLNPRKPDGTLDTTHLDADGSPVFARLVVEELRRVVPALAPVLRAEPDMDRDVEYGVAAGVSLKLDAHTPPGEGPFPIAILVHGGGWNSGDKAGSDKPGNGADITPWFAPLSEAKFTWFSINYRMAPAHRWPACFDDVQTAIRWAKANAAKFKGDPSRIVIFGHSAGGHLATLAGALGEGDTRVQAVVGYAPVTDFIYELPARGGLGKALQDLHGQPKEPNETSLAILRDTAAINRVKPGLPPFLLLHGDADKTVPYQTSLNFQAKLRANGVTADLITLPGAGHGLLQWHQFLPDYAAQMIAWLNRTLPPPAGKPAAAPDAVVSADNSGTHLTVQAAIDAAPAGRTTPWVIAVKPGRYREHLHIPADKPWITLRGDSADDTIITLDRNLATLDANGKKFSTPDSSTVLVDGKDFLAENITFENTTPREAKIQALAMFVRADRAVFRKCRFLGWQDTLRVDSPRGANVTEPDAPRPDGNARHHFADCYIEGHVDFIYAAGTTVFERCTLHVKADGYITAASTPEAAPFGYVFLDCKVTAGPAVEKGFYLGRPWRAHAATAFIRTELPAQLLPAGWHNWGKADNERTARYAEFGSTGPGANPASRVAWAKQLSAEEAAGYTVQKILAGRDAWDPAKR